MLRPWAGALRPPAGRPGWGTVAAGVLLWMVLSSPVMVGQWRGAVGGVQGDSVWNMAGWVLLTGVLVALAWAYPLVSLFPTVAASLVNPWLTPVIAVASYLAGRRTARALPAALGFVAIVVIFSALAPLLEVGVGDWLAMVVIMVFVGVFPWLVGRSWRQYSELVHAGWERAELLEREQRILADRERLRERSRIAGDMHDSLGHELSLIALRAGALEMASDLDEHHRTAATELRSAAATATERLREIIGVLRDESDPAPTEPITETVPELVERARTSGMAAELHREGETGQATPMVDRAAHRVVQESLTNATKHAPGAAVTVRLARTADETVVTVTNEPPPASPQPEPTQGNQGLVGLRERVRLAGGTLHTEARNDGGFEVAAHLPHAAGTVPDTAADAERSESARHLEHARRRARRGLTTAIVVPAGLGAGLGAIASSYYLFVTYASVLAPTEFAGLRVGQDRAAVERMLPAVEMLDSPTRPAPPGTTCQYYESKASPFARYDVYRLCFSGGRLVSTDVIPAGTDGEYPSPAETSTRSR